MIVVVPSGGGLGGNRCRYCGASIVWALTANGKRMPVDVEPAPVGHGMWVLWHYAEEEPEAGYHVTFWRDFNPSEAPPYEGPRWNAHWGTCPDRETARQIEDARKPQRQLSLLDGGKK